ncbi:MAG: hypothetical protein IT425_12305 [Pirellulales bacterium]|nr:hypothetical protein [Pirellulales bacterium]
MANLSLGAIRRTLRNATRIGRHAGSSIVNSALPFVACDSHHDQAWNEDGSEGG